MAEETTKGTETGKYLTRKYLIANLQNFWKSIKKYIGDQKFVDQSYVSGAINSAVDVKVEEALDSLTTAIDGKAEASDLEDLEATIDNKVDKVEGKGLSTNDFTTVLKDKLNNLPDSAATHSDMGFMSGDDKQKLDDLVENAVTTVEETLSATSENPVQSKVIKNELDKKVDKETLDPSKFFNQDLRLVESTAGDIVFEPSSTIKHVKLHTEKGEIIEKFYISGTETFNTFEDTNRDIVIPNPDGTEKPESAVYKFYVECLEFSDSGKYKPFILRAVRDSDNPVKLLLGAFES